MLTNVIDHPTAKAKQHSRMTDTRKKLSTAIYSWDFEVKDPGVKEVYRQQDNALPFNDLNAYVVDWEMTK